jgi:carboxyl-terminal processing protease
MKQIAAPTMLVALFAAVLVQVSFAIAERANDYEFFDTLIDIRHLLLDSYVVAPDDKAMQEAAIEAMLDTLEDPHTVFVPPRNVQAFTKDLRGTYVGIGAEVNTAEDYLTIVTPMDGSPALEAGMRAGDVVLEIEGESTFKKPIEESIDRLMGEANTPVKVKVRHRDGSEEELSIERRQIVTRTVKGLRRLGERWSHCLDEDEDIMYVRITQFNETTVKELKALMEQFTEDGLGGLVMDLRDNPGGELSAAVSMVDLFLDEGVIVSVEDRLGEGPTFEAQPVGTLPDFPMIVMVNVHSASASEIVAGALQENGRARVLGTRTHGKGSVQEVRTLSLNRGTLKVTTAYYHLTSGRNIHRRNDSVVWGVDPDPGLLVPVTDEAHLDNLRLRRQYEIIEHVDEDVTVCSDASWIREHLQDEQLASALDELGVRLTEGHWSAPPEDFDDAGMVSLHQDLARVLQYRKARMNELNRLDQRITELRSMTATSDGEPEPLIPENADLVAGTITVRDAEGNVVGEFTIDGGDVEMALGSIQLSRVDEEGTE